MKVIFDILISALPWIAIGLFIACSIVGLKAKNNEKELSKLFKVICWGPVVSFWLVAVMEMMDGNQSSCTTWLVIGVFNAVTNFAMISESKNNKEEKSHE